MKKLICTVCIAILISCNVSVDKQDGKDSVSTFDSTLNRVDDHLEKWGDSAKEKFKDIREDVKDRFGKNSTGNKHN